MPYRDAFTEHNIETFVIALFVYSVSFHYTCNDLLPYGSDCCVNTLLRYSEEK